MRRHEVTAILALGLALAASPSVATAANGDCGQPISSGPKTTSTDALAILKAAVGLLPCLECICDIDGSGGISATDALAALGIAVGQPIALNCPSCTPTTTTTTTTLGGTQPALTTGDFPGVSPCSDRDTLPGDATFLGVVANATGYDLLVNFTQFDAAGFPEICGLAAADNALGGSDIPWNPATDNVLRVCSSFSDNVRDFFNQVPTSHGPEFCRTGSDGFTLAMPRAGKYRKDSCVESGGNSYDVRTRATVSGPSADQTFASLGIGRSDLRACDGTTEIATGSAARAFISASPKSFTFSVKSGSCSGTRHLDVQAEIVCVKKRSSGCPPADFPCF